jgi:hypothetical protein
MLSMATFSHNQMDGAIRMLTVDSLVKQGQQPLKHDPFFGSPLNRLSHDWTYQSGVCLMETAYIRCRDEEYLLVGYEDGCLGLIKHGAPMQIFKTTKTTTDTDLSMIEAHYEHSDAIVSIDVFPDGPLAAAEFKRKTASGEKENATNESLILSVDRDGIMNLWKISLEQDEQILQFVS